MTVEITPEPDEDERRAIVAALGTTDSVPAAYASRWRASALDDLRDGALAEDGGGDAGVVQP